MEYTGGVFHNVSGGIKKGTANNGLLNTGLRIDLEKLAGWSGLSFHVNTLWIHYKDGSGEFIGDICGHNNIYHDKTFRLFTSYFQKTFWQDKATFRIGVLAFNDDFNISENGSLFLNSNFAQQLPYLVICLLQIMQSQGLALAVALTQPIVSIFNLPYLMVTLHILVAMVRMIIFMERILDGIAAKDYLFPLKQGMILEKIIKELINSVLAIIRLIL